MTDEVSDPDEGPSPAAVDPARPAYTVAVAGPARIDPALVGARLAYLTAARRRHCQVAFTVEADRAELVRAVAGWAYRYGLAVDAVGTDDTRRRSAPYRNAAELLHWADALVLFDDGSRDFRFHRWLAGWYGLRVATVAVPG